MRTISHEIVQLIHTNNPDEIVQVGVHDKNVAVWRSFAANFVIRPYVFGHSRQNDHEVIETFMQVAVHPRIYRLVKELLTAAYQNRAICKHLATLALNTVGHKKSHYSSNRISFTIPLLT